MAITLPEGLRREAEALARHEGITLETLVIQAVEHFLREQRYPPRVVEAQRRLREYDKHKKPTGSENPQKPTPRQRLRQLSRRKLTDGDDSIAEVRLAKARAYQLYLDNEDWYSLRTQPNFSFCQPTLNINGDSRDSSLAALAQNDIEGQLEPR